MKIRELESKLASDPQVFIELDQVRSEMDCKITEKKKEIEQQRKFSVNLLKAQRRQNKR